MAVLAYATNLLGTLEGNTVNARFAIRGKERPPTNIVIVKIDDKSFQDLNDYPFPRRYYARLIRRIAPLHPLAIGSTSSSARRASTAKTGTTHRWR